MPNKNKYVVYDTKTKLYYNINKGGGDCVVGINNATFFNYGEYQYRKKQDTYLRQNEKFVRINKDGSKKFMA